MELLRDCFAPRQIDVALQQAEDVQQQVDISLQQIDEALQEVEDAQ